MEIKTNRMLYIQTQEIAKIIAKSHGFELGSGISISSKMRSQRGRLYFGLAMEVQERIFMHEITDVVDAIEA